MRKIFCFGKIHFKRNLALQGVRTDLEGRLAAAETNLTQVKLAFESFRDESTRQSQKSLKKLEEVAGQIRSFQDMSEGKVSGVLNENEVLKVSNSKPWLLSCVLAEWHKSLCAFPVAVF